MRNTNTEKISSLKMPNADQLNPFGDLDGRLACDHFLGKTVEQAELLFHENPHYYQDDLMWMGAVAFRYYLPAAIRFIQDETVDGQSGFIDGFADTLEIRLQRESEELVTVAENLAAVCKYIIDHYDRVGDLPDSNEQSETLTECLRKVFKKNREVLRDIPHNPEDYIDLRSRYFALWEAFSDLAGE